MAAHVSAREARTRFAELTDRVRYTGEPVIVEKQGHPFVAVVSLADLEEVQRLRAQVRQAEFSRLAARAEDEAGDREPSEDDIVNSVRASREVLYRERYG